jgi:trimeric autotransporter adhesin
MKTILSSKRRHYVATVSIFLIMVALIAGMVGCAPAPTPTRYNLTMAVAPVGSGNATDLTNASPYAAGTVVNITAVAAVGYQFVNWTALVGTFANANAAQTTFTMPARYATVTANFALKAAEIRTWYDLDAIRDNLGDSYILMNDLDSTSAGYEELAAATANGGKGWEPIGSLFVDPVSFYIVDPVDPFTGSLDGQGYEIRDLFINRPDEDGVGLFGCVDGRGVVKNLGMVNVAAVGDAYVGGLVGANYEGTVSNSYSTGSVAGDGLVGGLTGGSRGTVSNSYSTGNVTGEGEWVGGLVGGNGGTVSNSYSTGRVTARSNVGGLVGGNWYIVSNSYSTGSVTGAGNVGGLVGLQHGGTVSNSYSTGSVTGGVSVGGLVGENHDGSVSNSYYSYDEVLINGRNIISIGGLCNEDFEQWLANDKFLDVNERLSQEDGYYLINDVNGFKSLLAFGQNGALKFRLTNDLDLGDEPNFYIPYLAGEFDGNGHKIWNLSFSSDFTSQVGLFGYLASGGKVTGVSAENVNITGCGIVGGLVGEDAGTVSDSYSTGRVAGSWSVGGLVGCIGWNGGTVSNSHYNCDEVLINGKSIITIGALFNEDFDQWLANDKFLDVNETLSQEDGYYLINDVSDFKQLLVFGQNDTLKFRLTNDLDLGGDPNFYIPYLAGEFDGNGHKISNLRLNFDFVAQVGLFGYVGPAGKVSEVGVENVDLTVTGGHQVGDLVGENAGTVSNSYSTGSVAGGNEVGGLVGRNKGTVSNSYSSGSVTGNWGVGGLVGRNYEGTVSNSYSTGSVAGGNPVGGLVGWNEATVSNSFWDTETSGQATSAGGTGKSTAEMRSIAMFSGVGWNIIAVVDPGTRNPSYIWNIVDGQTYPFLSWQPV